MKYLVTGGAGFIGSHIVDKLINEGHKVRVYDNFSTGRLIFIQQHLKNKNFELVKADLSNVRRLKESMKGMEFVFHLAAHADVKSGFENHFIDHDQNLEMTRNVLETMISCGVKKVAFTSTSSVYGDAKIHPTPEDYPFQPTSLYGATKAACESYIYTYSSYYKIKAYIFRFVSFLGSRYTHGIIFDVLKRLHHNPESIKLFSDGSPRKSSLAVSDGIDAISRIIANSKEQVNIYNIGHQDLMTVSQIIETILEVLNKTSVKKTWLGKKSNWKGDNEFVHLSINKLNGLGWTPKTTMKQAIAETVFYLQSNSDLLK